MPGLGELTVWSNMIHYHIHIPTNGKGNGAMGVGGASFSLKVERLLKLCTPIPLTRGIRQGLKSKVGGKGRGLGGAKCLVSDTHIAEARTREQTESKNSSLALTTLSPVLPVRTDARERIQSYLERSG